MGGNKELTPIGTVPEQYKILHREGYWERVLEIKQENNDLTVRQMWDKIEDEMSAFGMARYTTFISFKTTYYQYIRKKRNRNK